MKIKCTDCEHVFTVIDEKTGQPAQLGDTPGASEPWYNNINACPFCDQTRDYLEEADGA